MPALALDIQHNIHNDFWEDAFRYYAIFGFISALAVIQPMIPKTLAIPKLVNIQVYGGYAKTRAEIGYLDWLKTFPITKVRCVQKVC